MNEEKRDELMRAQATATARENDRFLTIALNLSGRREELEAKAKKLIERHGGIKALQISRANASPEFVAAIAEMREALQSLLANKELSTNASDS